MASVVLAALAGMGTAEHFVSIAEHLRRRGHRVSVVTSLHAVTIYRDRGFETHEVPEPAMPDLYDHLPPLLGRATQLFVRVQRNIIEPLPHQWAVLRQVLRSAEVDVVLTDPLFLGASMLAVKPKHLRPSVVMLGCAAPWIPDPIVPPYGMGLPPSENGTNRLGNAALRFVASRPLKLLSASFDRAVESAFGVATGGDILTSPAYADVWAQLTVPRLEYPRAAVPTNFRFVGPLHPPVMQSVPDWWDPLEEPPVVAVRAGSARAVDDLVLPTVRAVGDQDVTIIVTGAARTATARAYGEALPANVHFEDVMPWSRLIPGRSVVVSDGDYINVQHALRFGVPLVLAGTLETDVETAARVEWSGAGINLRTRRPSPAQIAAAAHRIASDPSFRSAAAGIAAQIAGTDAERTIAEIVEAEAAEHEAGRPARSSVV